MIIDTNVLHLLFILPIHIKYIPPSGRKKYHQGVVASIYTYTSHYPQTMRVTLYQN